MRRIAAALLAATLASFFASCSGHSGDRAVIWTDVPELAIAVELFDASKVDPSDPSSGAVELHWKPELAAALASAKAPPALAIGSYLGSSPARKNLASIDYLFRGGRVDRSAFYPELLAAGVVGGRRILIPISFNLPVIVFARGASSTGDGFSLSMNEMSAPSTAYNRREGKANYSRMGFSPRWDGRFLVSALEAGGAGFTQAGELAWNDDGLKKALGEIIDWVGRTNGSAALEDDFQFKYLFSPPYRYVKEGRSLFAYMDSSDFFRAPEERRTGIDFRWFARDGRVRVSDNLVCAALVRGAPGRKTAESFLRWLLEGETQRAILERSRRVRALDYSFGIAGGFSSLRSVNEESLPSYFPALVGHAPPAAALVAPAILPADWPALESAVVTPWAIGATAASKADCDASLGLLSESLSEFRKRGEKQ
jgi:hypothetical protein